MPSATEASGVGAVMLGMLGAGNADGGEQQQQKGREGCHFSTVGKPCANRGHSEYHKGANCAPSICTAPREWTDGREEREGEGIASLDLDRLPPSSLSPHRAAWRPLVCRRNETAFHGVLSGRASWSPTRERDQPPLLVEKLHFVRPSSVRNSFCLVSGVDIAALPSRDWTEKRASAKKWIPGRLPQRGLSPLTSPSTPSIGSPRTPLELRVYEPVACRPPDQDTSRALPNTNKRDPSPS